MIIRDCLYGEFEIDEVLSEIIKTKEIQRLKSICQGGASFLVNKNWHLTRYDHSIGTMLLIKQLNGSVEEQIAGLIHDISHTAFSHVVDYALQYKNEDYHEIIFDEIIKNSNIPSIIDSYGYDINKILDEKNWTILEKKAPKLCADRIDYTLRDMYNDKQITLSEVNDFLNSLSVINGEIVINSIKQSEWFVQTYYKEVIDYFMNPLNVAAYNLLSNALKISISINELNKEDFLKTDDEVLNILKKSKNKDILNILNKLNYNLKVEVNNHKFDIHHKTKLRTVDPTLYINNKLAVSSTLCDNISNLNDTIKYKTEKGIYIKIL